MLQVTKDTYMLGKLRNILQHTRVDPKVISLIATCAIYDVGSNSALSLFQFEIANTTIKSH